MGRQFGLARRVATVVALVVCSRLPSRGVLAQGPTAPPCELEAYTLSGHEGATIHVYPDTDGEHIFCHLAHESGSPPHLNIIPDGESCEIDCDRGYAGRATNKLDCKNNLPLPSELVFAFTCTGEPLAPLPPFPAATRTVSYRDDQIAHRKSLSLQRATSKATRPRSATSRARPAPAAAGRGRRGARARTTAASAARGRTALTAGRARLARGRRSPVAASARRVPLAGPRRRRARSARAIAAYAPLATAERTAPRARWGGTKPPTGPRSARPARVAHPPVRPARRRQATATPVRAGTRALRAASR